MKKKRIAVYHFLPPGGGRKTMYEFSKRLSRKYVLDLYTIGDKFEDQNESSHFESIFSYQLKEVSIIRSGPMLRLQEDFNFFFVVKLLHKKISSDIDKRAYDLVIISHDKRIQTPFVSRYLKTKSIYYCQEPWRIYYEYNLKPQNRFKGLKKGYIAISDYLRMKEDQKNARSNTLILANSCSSSESIYRAYGVYASVCHLGVDQDVFRKISVKKKKYMYVVGNLSPHKGHMFVIDALSMINAGIRPELLISSGGIDIKNEDTIKKYARDRSVKIRIIGRIKEEEIVMIYNQAEATLCAANLEALGLSAIESMACGTPVVAVNEGGYRDMIADGVSGILTNRDTKEFAESIKKIVKNKTFAERLSRDARQKMFPYWSWDEATKRLTKYMEQVIHT